MKKIWMIMGLIGVMVLFSDCTRVDYARDVDCVGPNWTSDNKVEFFKVERIWKHSKNFYSERTDLVSEKSWLCEINADGTGFKEIGLVFDDVHQWINTSSSAGEWVVFDNVTEIDNVTNSFVDGEIWIIKRDGTGLRKVGRGLNPDFSPDASKIVYEKPDSGIWIMDRDGTDYRQILDEGMGVYPSWSPDGSQIAYVSGSLYIIDTIGNIMDTVFIRTRGNPPDWGPVDSNAICITNIYMYPPGAYYPSIVYLETGKVDTLGFEAYSKICWSPLGTRFISRDENGYFIIKRDGTNKWYLKDKIEGGGK
ncbi:MAG: hypothetical protein DRQ02_11385 [Candidatus Latescibacterota bacterium]|nr:MAG: hypothetical protein DRQ02_11385 [Candidatus Latescibacterota bacterium]